MFFIEAAHLRLRVILPRPLLVASRSSLGGTAVGTVAVASWPPSSRRKPWSIPILGPISVRNVVTEAASCEPEGDAGIAPRPVRIVAVVGDGTVSPLKGASWEQAMLHTAERLRWADESCEMLVYTDADRDDLRGELARADILLMISVSNQEAIDWVRANSAHIPNVISFESASPSLKNKLGGSFVSMDGKAKTNRPKFLKTLSDAWGRHNSDDIRFCILVIINAYIRPVSSLKNLRAKGFSTLNCMIKNCGSEVLNCLLDPKCRKALQCLNGCSPTDQVCNYRCIASYESPNLEAFSLCVLQKHTCLGLDSDIPERPFVPPMERFRGEPLTHETAEDLFVGWLGELQWSWRVVAGQNPAYDQFPCQYQLFYRGKAKGSFWYEPVFRVKTLEGEMVWRRRRYSVRRSEDPGTFHLSIQENGVILKEFWTVVDVSDDLKWGLFHYRGAAAAAGQSYAGAVLVSPDGRYPPGMGGSRLASALDKCRIKNWELYEVDSDDCESADAPLSIPEGSSFHRNIDVRDETWASP
ncbi:unnamed protein product [Spirodela intermedia]|uniref:VDE lipocalin domain-containing protein n=1 Tax=Spirodela intermedia TaxID=51605 RepID=A0A7I8L132_SPIIN|nr:unnamed protein product [Spirodela intermedia]